MRDIELYRKILNIQAPWSISRVDLDQSEESVEIHLSVDRDASLCCPECGKTVPRYDKRKRSWRHLDTCQYETLLTVEIPRVQCPLHKVKQIHVPWAEAGSGYTILFESLVIDWLKEASIQAVRRQMKMSWNAIDGIMQRAVKRGLVRREKNTLYQRLGVDEIAFRKRHNYVSVITDPDRGTVVHVCDDRKKKSLSDFYMGLSQEQRSAIQSISMDMWQGFIGATLACIPDARKKISFDKFHVAQYLGKSVDQVRKAEHRALLKVKDTTLTGTKYQWQTNPKNKTHKQRLDFTELRESHLKTARAWAIKQLAMSLWGYTSRTWAEKGWDRWYSWAIRSRLDPVKKVAKMIKKHLWGIINAIVLKANNGHAESTNSRIKMVKVRARGFRNKDRFKNAIYFHLGGLDLYPESTAYLGEPT